MANVFYSTFLNVFLKFFLERFYIYEINATSRIEARGQGNLY